MALIRAYVMVSEYLGIMADALLGSRCDRCRQRVYTRDLFAHDMGCD